MKITESRKNDFVKMMTRIAERHNCIIGFDMKSMDINYMKIDIESFAILRHSYVINWEEEPSLTDAAVAIWADFFDAMSRDQVVQYTRHDVDITKSTYKQLLNSIYGAGHTYIPAIKDVIFNDPATIVFWADGTKTVVKCQPLDEYDPEKGLAMAISKKALGNNYSYYNPFAKWLKRYYREKEEKAIMFTVENSDFFNALAKAKEDIMKRFCDVK